MASYTRDQLENMTVKELRKLVVQCGISGYTKKPKGIIIDAILSKSGGSSTASVTKPAPAKKKLPPISQLGGEFSSMVTNPNLAKGKRVTTTIQVSCGASTGSFLAVGRKVVEVADFLREILNVASMSKGIVNGKEVDGDYVLKEGDSLEFVKPAGTKG